MREIEHRRIRELFRLGRDNISEPNINLHVNSGRIEPSRERRSDARVIGILSNCCAEKRRRIEDDAVIWHVKLGYLLHDLENGINLIASPA